MYAWFCTWSPFNWPRFVRVHKCTWTEHVSAYEASEVRGEARQWHNLHSWTVPGRVHVMPSMVLYSWVNLTLLTGGTFSVNYKVMLLNTHKNIRQQDRWLVSLRAEWLHCWRDRWLWQWRAKILQQLSGFQSRHLSKIQKWKHKQQLLLQK